MSPNYMSLFHGQCVPDLFSTMVAMSHFFQGLYDFRKYTKCWKYGDLMKEAEINPITLSSKSCSYWAEKFSVASLIY
jgi:hypothetical protein